MAGRAPGSESKRKRHARRAMAAAAFAAVLMPAAAGAAGNCSFKPSPPVTLKDKGFCEFDPERLSYAGDAVQQAKCLLNPVKPVGRLAPPLDALPAALAERVGQAAGLPERETLKTWLAERGLADPLGESLERSVSRARDNDPASPPATYFVIHDTSSPNYGAQPWPRNLDDHPKINNLARYQCANDIERAHVFINRGGAILLAHDFTVPWRATKFEMATNFNGALKGLFLHVELVQPRRRHPKFGRRNDFLAPDPGFPPVQYDALALIYTVASVRAGAWLIPGYHSVIDEGIRNKHDDPQNFSLDAFAGSLGRLLTSLKAPEMREAAKALPDKAP